LNNAFSFESQEELYEFQAMLRNKVDTFTHELTVFDNSLFRLTDQKISHPDAVQLVDQSVDESGKNIKYQDGGQELRKYRGNTK
jgi:hypothetical protein